MVAKPSLHLQQVHQEEIDVVKLLVYKISEGDSEEVIERQERKVKLQLLRNKGNHEHNKNVLQSKEGELILLRRPQGDGRFGRYLQPMPTLFWMG